MENYIIYIIFTIAKHVYTMHALFFSKKQIAWIMYTAHAMTTSFYGYYNERIGSDVQSYYTILKLVTIVKLVRFTTCIGCYHRMLKRNKKTS